MAGKTREIKGRMKAVGNIQRITRTMQMIATARYQALQRRATQAQPYTRKVAQVMGELAASVSGGGEVDHPLLSPGHGAGRDLLLVITSNRGLAGAYNANVLRQANRFLRERAPDSIDLEVVGKKGLAFFRFNGRAVAQFHNQIGDTPDYAQVEDLAQRYMDAFEEGGYDAVHVAYMSFESASKQAAKVIRLLPMEAEEGGKGPGAKGPSEADSAPLTPGPLSSSAPSLYEFTPSPRELLDELAPMAIKTRLFQCFNEAVVSEQLARMVAMKAATDAAGKMRKELGRRYNRARQAAITTELSEIIGGAAALE